MISAAKDRGANAENGTLSPSYAERKLYVTVEVTLPVKITCVRSSASLRAVDTMGVACDAPACLLRQKMRVGLPARTFRAKDWLDWC